MSSYDSKEMNLRDFWRTLTRRSSVVIVALVATVAPAITLSLLQAPIYEASARMLLQTSQSSTLFGDNGQSPTKANLVNNEIQVVEGEVVFQRVKTDLGLTADPPRATGAPFGDTDVVIVTVSSSDPVTAAALANAYVDAYVNTKRSQAIGNLVAGSKVLQQQITALQDQIDAVDVTIAASATDDDTTAEAQRRVLVDQQTLFKQKIDQLQVDAALTTGGAQLVRPAEEPTDPAEPNPVKTALLAIAVGLILGVGAAFVLDYIDDSVRDATELTKLGNGLPVLAMVPGVSAPDKRPIALSRPNDVAVEAYRTLRTNLQFMGVERMMQVFEVTSSLPGEGKTTTAANLAVVLSQAGSSVVLIDADLRKPRVHQMFAIEEKEGLTDALVGSQFGLIVRKIDENLCVITAGAMQPNPSEMLGSNRMRSVIEELKLRFDYVIIDSAPVVAVNDSVALARHVDAVILVSQLGRTKSPQVAEAVRLLEQVSAPLIGFVVNRAKASDVAGGTGYGYGYEYATAAH
ncbi:MAG: lipopolysaccharide biosynthesis [Acidimicrobiales bacterium]|nr:lipopolysaccharide biosynthesis [Acidimicrobiales bacterium]